MEYTDEQKKMHVSDIQTALQTIHNYTGRVPYIAVDGIYGEQTANAVRVFQSISGLVVTGKTDRDTWKALFKDYFEIIEKYNGNGAISGFPSPTFVLEKGTIGGIVYVLQTMINAIAPHFANISMVEYTGILDNNTSQQVENLKKAAEIEQTGSVDWNTWQLIVALFNTYSTRKPIEQMMPQT